MRSLSVLLLFCSLAAAQAVDELVERAMRPTTGPKERLETMQELIRREGGDAALARSGLDPVRDPEVVHMTVEVLLDSGRTGPFIASICRLLLNDRHKEKVEERIYRYTETPEAARRLVGQLAGLARGTDAGESDSVELRRAAVIALGRIFHRSAVDVIASIWADAGADAAVREQCRAELDGVVLVTRSDQVLDYLEERRYETYADLVREVSRYYRSQNARNKEIAEKFAVGYFRQADPAEVFGALQGGSPIEKRAAAKRALELAKAKDFGADGDAAAFAGRLIDFLLVELPAGPTTAAQDAISALIVLSNGGAFGEQGLPRAEDLRNAIVEAAGGGAESAEFAKRAMELLSTMGADALTALAEFVERHATDEVRVAAVDALGAIASPDAAPATRRRVGEILSELLATPLPRPVRRRLLYVLRTLPSEKALPTIEKLLAEEEPGKALDPIEVENAMELLALTPSPDALALLARFARSGRDERMRVDAIDHGLIPRLRNGLPPPEVVDILGQLVRDREQLPGVRAQVLTSLSARGYRRAATLLGELAADGTLEPEYRKQAAVQRVRLGERLLKGNGDAKVSREDVETIVAVLGPETAGSVEHERLLNLAANAVQAATRATIPAGLLRTRYAELREKAQGVTEADLRAAWKDAADNAVKDGLSDGQRRAALGKFRPLAARADRVNVDLELMALAREDETKIKHWLDALEGAVELKDKPLSDKIVQRRPAGEFAGPNAARRDRLLAAYEKLS